ncbi:hypothetical protein IQ06DRAFT_334208 [Phaeosphaeriaceae sp. SRC1lsM3a]|nr:hypothetical protein IQ06DRAFT_334208 [Stagonospora sp. SRC1lsM3a]
MNDMFSTHNLPARSQLLSAALRSFGLPGYVIWRTRDTASFKITTTDGHECAGLGITIGCWSITR